MPSSADIYSRFAQPVRSPQEIEAALMAGQQNRLALQLGQQKADEYARGLTEQNDLRTAVQGFGADQTANYNRLLQTGNLKAAQDYQKSGLDAAKAKGDIAHVAAQTTESSVKSRAATIELNARNLVSVSNPEQAGRWYDEAVKRGDIAANEAEALKANIPTDPGLFSKWKLDEMSKGLALHDKLTLEQNAANAKETARSHDLTRATALETNAATNARMAAEGAANRGVAMRGQNMTDARASETAAAGAATREQGKVPPGYRKTDTGDLQAIPGGPADLKLQGALNQDTQALVGTTAAFDRLGSAANEVLKHPGLSGITGKMGVIPNVPGSQAANAEALLGTLKSQAGFAVLQDLRNNSKTGGALGSVSDAEGKRLEANLAALDKSQSVEQFKANLQKIVDYTDKAKDRMRDAYNLKHVGQAKSEPGQTLKFDAQGNQVK